MLPRQPLGATGLEVSIAGLGCGGHSRLGLRHGKTEAEAEDLVRHALSLGVNFLDTARAYGTEAVVGRAVASCRDQVVLSTKTMFREKDGSYMPVERLIDSLEKSLTRLQTDYIDVFSFHGVTPEHLDHCLHAYVPALQQQIDAGKIRHLGITESFRQDPRHEMLIRAIPTGSFDVVMVGFNLLNPGARDAVLPLCEQHGVGTQVMHAVRNALSDRVRLVETAAQLIENGEIEAAAVDVRDPLGFLEAHPDIQSIVEAAYRFCRHERGVSVVLTGTGSMEHLEANIAAIGAPPLPDEVSRKLSAIFGQIRSVSGD